MNRVCESIVRFILRERFLQQLEKDVIYGERTAISVFLRKGTEYIVRGRLLDGHGKLSLSLSGADPSATPVYYSGDNGTCLSVIPQKDSLYDIWVSLRHAGTEKGFAPVAVMVSSMPPIFSRFNREIESLLAEVKATPAAACQPEEEPAPERQLGNSGTAA